jgi:hypothetical protein
MRGTGGGKATPTKLTILEEKLIDFMGESNVYGMEGVAVFGMNNKEVRFYEYIHQYLFGFFVKIQT